MYKTTIQPSTKWTLKPDPDHATVLALQNELGIEVWLAKLLVQRGINTLDEAKLFFRPSIEHLHDPFEMKDMQKAVDRLSQALENKETIMVFGDYDVDGTTAVAMLSEFLQSLDAQVISYIPDRYKEGYGVSIAGVQHAIEHGVKLMFTLDCGIKAIGPISLAEENGIDVIVCDHHQPGELLPPALAILDPQQEDCAYPYPYLCGAGVTFKMIQAWWLHQGGEVEELSRYFDLLTISIGADIVPMTGENRTLASLGLLELKDPQRPGIKALWNAAKFDRPIETITDVVFGLAPRINAAGRMESGNLAVELLMCNDQIQADEMAAAIELLNQQRKKTDQLTTEEALKMIAEDPEFQERKTTVVHGETWHKGVIGIVASRLIEKHFRPTIVLTVQGEMLTGSCRSIPQVNVYEAIEACSQHLERYGGHPMAAGLTLKKEKLPLFKEAFEIAVTRQLGQEIPVPEIEVDAELKFSQVTARAFKILEQMGPFGPDNMSPVFASTQVIDTGRSRTVGKDNAHLKAHFTQNNISSPDLDGIGFSLGAWITYLQNGGKADIVYCLERNTFRDKSTIQLHLKDIRESE